MFEPEKSESNPLQPIFFDELINASDLALNVVFGHSDPVCRIARRNSFADSPKLGGPSLLSHSGSLVRKQSFHDRKFQILAHEANNDKELSKVLKKKLEELFNAHAETVDHPIKYILYVGDVNIGKGAGKPWEFFFNGELTDGLSVDVFMVLYSSNLDVVEAGLELIKKYAVDDKVQVVHNKEVHHAVDKIKRKLSAGDVSYELPSLNSLKMT